MMCDAIGFACLSQALEAVDQFLVLVLFGMVAFQMTDLQMFKSYFDDNHIPQVGKRLALLGSYVVACFFIVMGVGGLAFEIYGIEQLEVGDLYGFDHGG